MSLPPVFAASALYDSLLQAALRQFFGRATFETEPIPSLSSDGRLAIEPTNDPSVLSIRWFGSRHVLHVPARRPFTAHEVRLARAIGTVLAARYRAIFDPKQMLERGELFRGAIEDRYVGAFLDAPSSQATGASRAPTWSRRPSRCCASRRSRATRIGRSRPGVLLLEGDDDPVRPRRPSRRPACTSIRQALTAIKSFYRLCDGMRTLFLVNRNGDVLDIVEIARYADGRATLTGPVRDHATVRTRWRRRATATSASS